MASYNLPPSHINEDPRDTVYSVGDYDPTALGDLPELAVVFKSLYNDIAASQVPDYLPDESVEWEILPIGHNDSTREPAEEPTVEREPTNQVRDLGFLFELRDTFGSGSRVVQVSMRSRDSKHKEERPEPYYATIINNKDGSLHAVVTDTSTENNSLYVWRSDVTDLPAGESWTRVFSNDKRDAKSLQAVDVRHNNERYKERVLNLITMPAEEFMDVVTSEPGKRPRL